ncbi:MAG: hypothetical protein VX821_06090, partial [Verrucomicrobiota bacterium]|nr:hypothetical protein [Verrucomicrobiota bacterium]
KLDREQTGNRQTISENRQDLPLEREDLSRERNSESTLILERSERSEPQDKQFLPISAERS